MAKETGNIHGKNMDDKTDCGWTDLPWNVPVHWPQLFTVRLNGSFVQLSTAGRPGNLSPHCTAHTFRNTDVYTQADSLFWDLHREQPIHNKPDRYNQTHQTHSVHSQRLCLTVYGADSICTGVPELQTEDFTIVWILKAELKHFPYIRKG